MKKRFTVEDYETDIDGDSGDLRIQARLCVDGMTIAYFQKRREAETAAELLNKADGMET